MNLDEFAFVNQQLAAMLRDGIPLEGALRQLCETMARGKLRDELTALEADLSRGTPLEEALTVRKLPELYVKMLQVGAKSGDLPGVLTMLADYYQQVNSIWTRLKGLMVYPLIVLVVSFVVASGLGLTVWWLGSSMWGDLLGGIELPPAVWISMLAPVVITSGLMAVTAVTLINPCWRRAMYWRVSPWRDAALGRLASAMALMLKSGCPLPEVLALAEQLEKNNPAGEELRHWQQRLATGHSGFADLAIPSRVIPPLFVWLVVNSRENPADGLQQAASVYLTRAAVRVEMMLQAALPVAILFLGILIFSELLGVLLPLFRIVSTLGG